MRSGVVCGGSFCVDHNKQIDHWPAQETVARITDEQQCGGGSAHNMSVDLIKLQAPFPVGIIALVGDDADGHFLRQSVVDLGIDGSQIHTAERVRTSYTDALMPADSGRRTHFYHSGTNGHLHPDHFDFTRTDARILHLGLPGLHDALDAPCNGDASGWVTVLKRARAAGLKTNLELVSVDDRIIRRLGLPCLAHLDYLIVNDSEIGALAGIDTVSDGRTDLAACERAVQKVASLGAMEFVVAHFPLGAIACTRSGQLLRAASVALPASEVAGSNGAGDAFAAGMLLAVHEGWSIDDALALGHACAAASLRQMTTVGAVEPYRTCLERAAHWGTRDTFKSG